MEQPVIDDLQPPKAPDGQLDSFVGVRRGAELGFEVHLANRNVTPSDVPQRFRLVVQILGDGLVLQERVLRVVVPAAGPDAPKPVSDDDDAG